MANAPTPVAVDASELSSTPQSGDTITMSPAEFHGTAAPKSTPSGSDTITMSPAAFAVDASELQSEQEFRTANPQQTPQTPETTPLRDKPIPDQPAPSRQRQEFLRKTGGGSTTEQGISEANTTAEENAGLLVASQGVGGLLSKFVAPATKLAEAGSTAEITKDALGNTVIKSVPNMVETTGKSMAQQGIAKGIEIAKQVEVWVAKNPAKAYMLEKVANELGIDPFQLAHKVVKYGKDIL
jgi:hypothetical protein